MRSRIMYLENKAGSLNAMGRIGRVTFSKTGTTIYYGGKSFQSLRGGYKANFYDLESGEQYWISGPKKAGGDRLYGTPGSEIDEDVREEYWTTIRNEPKRSREATS